MIRLIYSFVFSVCEIILFLTICSESGYSQYAKNVKTTTLKNPKPQTTPVYFSDPLIKFGEFSKTTFHQIGSEFEKSIELLKDTSNLPDSIFNHAYKGDFALSGFAISIAELEKFTGKTKNSGRNIKMIIQLLNLEAKNATTFSQLNLLKTIRLEGLNLLKNEYWNLLTNQQKEVWKAATDVRRMYDPVLKTILNGRPTNYLGVAIQIATLSYELGFERDEKMVNKLLDHCILQLEKNNGWLNDGRNGEFRFDRYHFEYIRFVWESAERMHRMDILEKLRSWCERSDNLWLGLMHPVSGSTFAYGRSLQNTWEDVWEYGVFMLKRKQRKKEEGELIMSQIFHTWNYYFKNEYDTTRHIARILDAERACYSYVGPNRVWGYSVHALGKMAASINEIRSAGYGLSNFPQNPAYQPINHFFELKDKFGIWVIKTQNTRLIIPLVTGIGKPKNSDYQPIPFAEGISEPPVNLPTTHLLPGIYKRGKMYLPDLKLVSFPKGKNPDPIQLETGLWISKSDTLPADSSPILKVLYRYSKSETKSQLAMHYSLENKENIQADSVVYSIWQSKWKGSPYEMGSYVPHWEILANDFAQKEFAHDLSKPDGRGAFTALPNRTDLVKKSPKENLKWAVKLNFD